METYLCTVIVCVLISSGLVAGQTYNIPAVSFNAPYDTPGNEINEPYLDGVSITYGTPRKHIWSLYGGNGLRCCSNKHINFTENINFIGNNSFCDSGNPGGGGWRKTLFTELPLWDGIAGCSSSPTCCAPTSGPWFRTTLTVPTISDIEIRICGDQHLTDEDTPVGLIDVYIR